MNEYILLPPITTIKEKEAMKFKENARWGELYIGGFETREGKGEIM